MNEWDKIHREPEGTELRVDKEIEGGKERGHHILDLHSLGRKNTLFTEGRSEHRKLCSFFYFLRSQAVKQLTARKRNSCSLSMKKGTCNHHRNKNDCVNRHERNRAQQQFQIRNTQDGKLKGDTNQ
ncbi:hypothetical protein Mapa_016394 [Marchantia paleacea]|nr:hypothetical protein Mapa_016394 [Marchantia paleacea]